MNILVSNAQDSAGKLCNSVVPSHCRKGRESGVKNCQGFSPSQSVHMTGNIESRPFALIRVQERNTPHSFKSVQTLLTPVLLWKIIRLVLGAETLIVLGI